MRLPFCVRGHIREGRRTDTGLLPQQHASIAAVSIVTVHTLSLHCRRVLRRLFVACKTDLFFRLHETDRSGIAVSPRYMTDRARNGHGGVH
jgi:hypothetical protein